MGYVCLNFFIIFLLSLVPLAGASANNDIPLGYLHDVKAERQKQFYEIDIFSFSPPAETDWQRFIFNKDLSREFKNRYVETFGYIDTDSVVYQSARWNQQQISGYGPAELDAQNKQRHQFADYIVKRLSEWHVDNYVKSKPEMKPIYEAKEKLSHVELKVTQESKFDVRYSLAGNTMDLIYDNPWVDSKVVLEMDSGTFGPSTPQESRLFLGKNIDPRLRVNSIYANTDGIATLQVIRGFPKNHISTSISGSTYTKPEGVSLRESKVAVGLSHSW